MLNANYSKEPDILVIEKDSYENYSKSIESNGIIVDLDSNSHFLGLEIIDISHTTSLGKEELAQT